MKFLRFIVVFFLCTLYFVPCTSPIKASGEFSVDATVTYNIQDSGKTLITHNIDLTNNATNLYATSYSLELENIDAANISYNLLKTAAGNGIAIGPLLLGVAKPIHILTPAATVRRIVNVTTLAVVEAASNARGIS